MLSVAVCALPLSWFSVRAQRARKQREAVTWIQKLGGSVAYGYQRDDNGRPIPNAEPPGPKWLMKQLGIDFFDELTDRTADGFVPASHAHVFVFGPDSRLVIRPNDAETFRAGVIDRFHTRTREPTIVAKFDPFRQFQSQVILLLLDFLYQFNGIAITYVYQALPF